MSDAKSRILIVDDNPDISETSEMLLTYAGHEVRCAASGSEAIEVALEFQPRVILLDIGLPDMSGHDVARRLRQMQQFATTQLIAVSGYDTPEARSKSEAAGFNHHVAKPVDLEALQHLFA